MVDYSSVRDNILHVQEKIHSAALRSGRNPDDIALVAVTKFHPIEAVIEAYKSGIRRFGENRVQEAETKYFVENRRDMPDIRLDMLGTLQSNKINRAMKIFDCIQSIGSSDTLKAVISRVGMADDHPIDLFLELRTGEKSKSGFSDSDALLKAVEEYLAVLGKDATESQNKRIRLVGLMTMAPFTSDRQEIRTAFRTLYKAKDEIDKRFMLRDFCQLSMGMSGDFEIAIEEGSTLLRIGTALFGARQ